MKPSSILLCNFVKTNKIMWKINSPELAQNNVTEIRKPDLKINSLQTYNIVEFINFNKTVANNHQTLP